MNFVEEFKRRCLRIRENRLNREVITIPDDIRYKVIRYRSDALPVEVMWHLTEEEAKRLLSWKFVTGVKHEDGEEVLVWYKVRAMEPTR